jgi:hypothetical protein
LRVCVTCKINKPIEAFGIRNKAPDGLAKSCKQCASAASKKHRDANKKEVARKSREYRSTFTKEERRDKKLWERYKLTPMTVQGILKAQDDKCMICEEDLNGVFVVDHDHSHCSATKGCEICVRGFLCHHCNSLLGYARDNVYTLKRAIAYLETDVERFKDMNALFGAQN